MASVLMIDDDRELCEMVVRYLSDDGFEASAVHNGTDGLATINRRQFDLVILDVMLPEMGGQEVLRQLRATPSPNQKLPVVMLTARGEEVDRVVGLETGADDYIAKPCSLRELVARIRAVLRRVQPSTDELPATRDLSFGELEFDLFDRSATYRSRQLDLTGAEYAILFCLAQARGSPVAKDSLTRAALGREYHPTDRSIDVHIANLRKKLSSGRADRLRINTLRGGGYWLVVGAQ